MTLDLEPIKKRAEWMLDNAAQCHISPGQVSLSGYVAACIDCGRDVSALIDEVERLRSENESSRLQIHGLHSRLADARTDRADLVDTIQSMRPGVPT
jgi:hypothetical protein